MSRQRSRDTGPEMLLRSELHRRGLRFRIHLRPERTVRRQADIVFRSARVAVFVDGCFWHGCPEHASWPQSNAAWWKDKIEANRRRDEDTRALLEASGWRVERVWEHEPVAEAANRIESSVRARCADRSLRDA